MTTLTSENVILAAPMSYTGSAKRIWRLQHGKPAVLRWTILIWLALTLIPVAWLIVSAWYATFGLLLVPYRLVRRAQRRDKQNQLRHRELLDLRDAR